MDAAALRHEMVDRLEEEPAPILTTQALARAMRTVPREDFLEDERVAHADRSHHVAGTTVLAPSTVARLFEALQPESGERTLIVGAGVGYTAAVMAELVGPRNVHAVDLSSHVVRVARANLSNAGYPEVLITQGDGAQGLPEYAPYDRILVETATVEPPRQLLGQRSSSGRLVFPQGRGVQELVALEPDGAMVEYGTIALEPMLVPGEEVGAIERNRTAREDREFAERAATRRSGWERDWIDWDSRVNR